MPYRPLFLLLFAALLCACAGTPAKPAPVAPPAATAPAKAADGADDTQRIGDIVLTRIAKSQESPPTWAAANFLAEEEGILFATGKASSLRSPFSAQHAAIYEAIGALIRAHLGEKLRAQVAVDFLPDGGGVRLVMQAKLWFGKEPEVISDFRVVGAYDEEWEGNGQRVYVSFVRVSWPKASLNAVLARNSI